MAPNVGQIINVLNLTKGSTMRFTLSRNTLQQLASQVDDDAAQVLQKALSGAKNPTAEFAAKSSEQGYAIAGMILRDGERQIGRGAVSVTGFGKPDAVWKTKFSLLDGKVQAGGHLDIGRSPDIDNIAYNIANRNGQLTINGIGNNSHGYALVNTKAIMDAEAPGAYNEFIGEFNQPMARFMQGLRNWSTGEGPSGWWKTPLAKIPVRKVDSKHFSDTLKKAFEFPKDLGLKKDFKLAEADIKELAKNKLYTGKDITKDINYEKALKELKNSKV